jgi:Domain of unknown function (DUF4337)
MAEIEIHHEHPGDEHDPLGKTVGFMVGIIGVILAIVTIAAHREHTAAVIHRTEANDAWAYYQAKKIREHTASVGLELLGALGDTARTEKAMGKLESQRQKYVGDAEEIKSRAEAKDKEMESAEVLALKYDLGEGFLELGLVLSSLYFLGRQKFFPVIGGLSAICGLLVALTAFPPLSGLWAALVGHG